MFILLLATTVPLALASGDKHSANEKGTVPRETVDYTHHARRLAHAASPAPPGPAQAFLDALAQQCDALSVAQLEQTLAWLQPAQEEAQPALGKAAQAVRGEIAARQAPSGPAQAFTKALHAQRDTLSVAELEQTLAWLQAGAAEAVQGVLDARLPVTVRTLDGGHFELRVRDGAGAVARAKAQIQATHGTPTRHQRLFVLPEESSQTEPPAKSAGAGAEAQDELEGTAQLPKHKGAPAELLLLVNADTASFVPTKKHDDIELTPDHKTATAKTGGFKVALLEGTEARLKLVRGAVYVELGVVPAGGADFGRALDADGYAYRLAVGAVHSDLYGGIVREGLPKLAQRGGGVVQDGDEVLLQLRGDALTYSIFQGDSQELRPHAQNPFSVTVDAALAEGARALAVEFYGEGEVKIVDHA